LFIFVEMNSPVVPSGTFERGGPHSFQVENLFIGISGLIGAGKSTLATSLGAVLGSYKLSLLIHESFL
jgi:pantothenate kinase-related protein Tda10